jgi:Uma2 family endonuclease
MDRLLKADAWSALQVIRPDKDGYPERLQSNTKAEMSRKLREYFEAGVHLVWLVDPRKRTVRVHTAVDHAVLFSEGQSIDGGAVLPGFVLPLNELFAEDEP